MARVLLICIFLSFKILQCLSQGSEHTEQLQDCNGQRWWKEKWHGIKDCWNGFTDGDNAGEKEKFIQAYEYNSTCANTCKTLYPTSIGITESLSQTYEVWSHEASSGWMKNKCWCEFGTPILNPTNNIYEEDNYHYYQTCVFEDEPLCYPVSEEHLKACTHYTNLTEEWRRIDNSTTTKDIHCDGDKNSTELNWYRFTGAAGSKLPEGASVIFWPDITRIVNSTGTRNCGSSHLAWIMDGRDAFGMGTRDCQYSLYCHPSLGDGIETKRVCIESAGSAINSYISCIDEWDDISVAACKNGDDGKNGDDEYFVYKLNFRQISLRQRRQHDIDNGCWAYCAVE